MLYDCIDFLAIRIRTCTLLVASTVVTTARPGINCQPFDSDSGHLSIGESEAGIEPIVPGTEAILLCYNGMEPVGNNDKYRCGRDGNWSPYPECGCT